jgi:hypothetical protein
LKLTAVLLAVQRKTKTMTVGRKLLVVEHATAAGGPDTTLPTVMPSGT